MTSLISKWHHEKQNFGLLTFLRVAETVPAVMEFQTCALWEMAIEMAMYASEGH